ncbi:isoprenylcysteine carboxylmethyltransferase family protein [Patescibacteria group bacterium]|nr:isoprenylcysteine carboxylmethyltransferase family protein [Patescibacteria group bacterium]
MNRIEIILLAGISLYYLSRLIVRQFSQQRKVRTLKIKRYVILLIGAEVLTVFVIWLQLFVWPGKWEPLIPWQTIGMVVFFLGIILSVWGRFTLKENWHTAMEFARPKELIISGPYHYIRHPIYFGSLLMGLGFELTISSWLFFAVLLLGPPFIWVCAHKEEQLLLKWLNREYQDYKRQTNRFIPFIW